MSLREYSVSCLRCTSYFCCCKKTSEAVDVRKFMRASHGGEAEVQQEEQKTRSSRFRMQA